MKKLWVFHVTGGQPFRIHPKGNLPMVHEGGTSLLRCLCTQEEAERIKTTVLEHEARVTAHCPSETPEQATERKNILQVLGGERVFPSVRCPQCIWFDPHLDSLCGAGLGYGEGWESEVAEINLEQERFRKDFDACPLRNENTRITE